MLEGRVDGYFIIGQNPAVGSANARQQRLAMAKLKVARGARPQHDRERDLVEGRTGDRVRRTQDRGDRHRGVLPARRDARGRSRAASHRPNAWSSGGTRRCRPRRRTERTGLLPRSGRTDPARLADSDDPRDRPILIGLTWDYPVNDHGDIDPEAVLVEINGRWHLTGPTRAPRWTRTPSSKQTARPGRVLDILASPRAASIRRPAGNRRRPQRDPIGVGMGMAGPIAGSSTTVPPPIGRAVRGVSARSTSGGTKRPAAGSATTFLTSPATTPPGRQPEPGAIGADAIGGDDPFIMQSDGKGWLFAPSGLVDGPLPTHYEAHGSRRYAMRCTSSSRRRLA